MLAGFFILIIMRKRVEIIVIITAALLAALGAGTLIWISNIATQYFDWYVY